ncbi:MAG: AlpA family phage regulatory protein [Synergistaceae bacterium]|nr:AlpA family phage regulatory protein [Synergistaceae bacterium]
MGLIYPAQVYIFLPFSVPISATFSLAVAERLLPAIEAIIDRKLAEMAKAESPEPGGLLRLPAVLELVAVSRAHWRNLVKEGKAPAGVKLSDKVTVWRNEEIEQYIWNGSLRREGEPLEWDDDSR